MIKVLICDDQAIVREGLTRILGTDHEIKVTGAAHDGADALEMVTIDPPDVVLMDLKMPIMNGIIATRQIKARFPGVFVLVLTTYEDDEWLFDALHSGAAGYLLKDTPPADLIAAIKGTAAGKTYLDPGVAGKVLGDYIGRPSSKTPPPDIQLSERETEVLQLLAQGLSNVDIAQQLYLTEGTVRNYTSDIFKKLGVSDRTQAAIAAIRYGLVDITK
jgi:DNA-binding NarL/FixJ family response regulator